MLTIQGPDNYTDFNALARLKNEAKDKTPASIKEVAKQFESVFVGMMLKSMRQAKLADGILDSSQSDFYQDMYDKELSLHLAGEQGIGLADIIARQLSPDQSSAVVRDQQIVDYQRQFINRIATQGDKKIPQKVPQVLSSQANSRDMTSSDFVNQIRPYAEKAAIKLGVDANLLLSQAALETGWGKSVIKDDKGNSSHNLFNIKADKSWQGKQVNVATLEFKNGEMNKEMAGFRAYASYQDSIDDYVDFIKTNPRYKLAMAVATHPERYIKALQQAGYATDPEYASKVIKIYHSKVMQNQTQDLLTMNLEKVLK